MSADHPANRSKTPTRSETSLGINTGCFPAMRRTYPRAERENHSRALEVRPRASALARRAGRKLAARHLLQLLPRLHLLSEQGRLDAVEETFEPTDELRLG